MEVRERSTIRGGGSIRVVTGVLIVLLAVSCIFSLIVRITLIIFVTNLVEVANAWGMPQALKAVFMTSPPFH